MGKLRLAIVAGIILIIPFIIVFQLSKSDINISDLTFPINGKEPFHNQCFFGEPVCVYDKSVRFGFSVASVDEIEINELPNEWRVIGEDVFCFKIESGSVEPVSDPVGVITERESNVTCNNIAMFDKNDWDLNIKLFVPDAEGNLVSFSSFELPEGSINRFTFTMKGQ